MYPNLRAELARKKITLTQVAEHLGMTLGTLSLKVNGKSELTFHEVCEIKRYLGVDIPLEELFASEG